MGGRGTRSLPVKKTERDRGRPRYALRNSIHRQQKNSLAGQFFLSYSSPYPLTQARHPDHRPILRAPT
ncbi:hypothetical protein C6T65_28070 [Burkholderia vietnamiensis]|uniref:Uncharacterized protein n=1 Tax=Burkholderia vietnamiensis TaxID=60552 RepID=A0AA44Y0M2_BURVI|nr:hypothetical protein A8H33_08435 [Burkholderia vietnamiensis]PRH39094.1 hypothetical protein C6T65_28070 [Burkholderia vietnamiensis]